MRLIKVSEKQLFGSGRFGNYFRLSQRMGVKISKIAGYANPALDVTTKKNQKVIKEATIGILAGGPTKELVLVQYKNKFFMGILQKHISGSMNKSVDVSSLKKDLNKKEVVHGDLHSKNVIVNKSGSHVIDFDPDLSYFVGKKQTYYTVKNKLIKNFRSSLSQNDTGNQ